MQTTKPVPICQDLEYQGKDNIVQQRKAHRTRHSPPPKEQDARSTCATVGGIDDGYAQERHQQHIRPAKRLIHRIQIRLGLVTHHLKATASMIENGEPRFTRCYPKRPHPLSMAHIIPVFKSNAQRTTNVLAASTQYKSRQL